MSSHRSRISKLEEQRTSRTRTGIKISPDPVVFAQSLGIEPDPWQRDLLTATDDRIILNCARQSGKSTIVAVAGLHHALTTPNALVLIMSPTLRQSALLCEKIIRFHQLCGSPLYESHSATVLHLSNGSRIVSLPGSEQTIRGYSAATLVLIDEASQVSDILYHSVTPMLATSQGRLILLSTPRGKQSIFWRAWNEKSDWLKIAVTADECPRIPKAFLDSERRSMTSSWFAQEYYCEFVQPEGSLFNEGWIQCYDPAQLPLAGTVIQSWDIAFTKSETSDYTVGQVWLRSGADYYLLDQVRGKFNLDEIEAAIKMLSDRWPQSTAKVIEGQILGATLASHLQHHVDGIIPVNVRGSKEERALNCLALWKSGNVYVPHPDNNAFAWVYDYVHELTTFPGAEHDDMVDATTLALNQLRGTLFPRAQSCAVENTKIAPTQGRYYRVGWIPALPEGCGVILVLDEETLDVVSFERVVAKPIEEQVAQVVDTARTYNDAYVCAQRGFDEAMLRAVEWEDVPVVRVTFTPEQWTAAYENLSMLIAKGRISYPNDPNLVAELQVFKSEFSFSWAPDYPQQRGQDSAIRALCLVTHKERAEEIDWAWDEVYYAYDDPYDWEFF